MSAPAEPEEQVFSSDEEDLECVQLREKISIKQIDMLHLINDQNKFLNSILEHIGTAKSKIDLNEKQQLKFALVHLKESQKILEYAASSGKNINKELIITVLHNQASIYQKLWELNCCSDYLEGIIYNYENFIRETSNQGSTLSKDIQIGLADPTKINMKQKLARYNLQFCAVSSQLGSHDAAIHSVSKAHSLMVECITGSIEQFRREWSRLGDNSEQIHLKLDLLIGLSHFSKKIQSSTQVSQLSRSITKATHFSLQMWQQSKKRQYPHLDESNYLQYLNSYSIGNIVQIVAINLDKAETGFSSMKQHGHVEFQRQFTPFNRAILLSTCFFSRATELRLKSAEMFRKNLEERKFCREYKQSICYHLIAISIVASFIPVNVKFLNQILLSYEKHYGVNLTEYVTVEVQSLTKMMELLAIEITALPTMSKNNTEKADLELNSKNDYNMKTNFEHHRGKKLQKMRSLKKITKQLTDPVKKYDQKELKTPKNKSKDSKTSFSISKYEKKDRTVSRNNIDKKSIDYRISQSRQRAQQLSGKAIPKVKSKKNQLIKSRQREDKKSRTKHYVDETEELFFCFTKKTKKTQGVVGSPNSQLRSSSIHSNSARSKNSKKSLLSPRNMKIGKVSSPTQGKAGKTPPKRKNIGEPHYYF